MKQLTLCGPGAVNNAMLKLKLRILHRAKSNKAHPIPN